MIAAVMLLAAVSGPPAIAPGTYTYSASFNGSPIGTSTVVVKTGAVTQGRPTTEIDESSSGAMNGKNGSAKVTLLLGDDLAPIAYSGSYDIGGQPLAVNVALTATAADVGGQSFDLTAATKHFVVLEPGLLAGLIALPGQMQAWNDGAVMAIVPSFPISAPIVPDASLTGTRPSALPATDVAVSFSGEQPFTVWYDPATLVPDEVDVAGSGLVVTRNR